MDDGRFYTATAETKLQHAELFRASVGVPRILLWRLSRIFFAAYNAGPGRIASMRKEAAKGNLDPDNKWFNVQQRQGSHGGESRHRNDDLRAQHLQVLHGLRADARTRRNAKKAREVVKRFG
jgi:hypothetical protein